MYDQTIRSKGRCRNFDESIASYSNNNKKTKTDKFLVFFAIFFIVALTTARIAFLSIFSALNFFLM